MKGKKKGKMHKHKHVNKKDKHNSPGVTGYIARSQVTKRLQLSIQDFRKLCIFKGIHPVEPGLKRIRKQSSKTWYYLKDINFMRRDELVKWYREMSTYKKKVAYLKGVNRPVELEALKQRKPKLNMDHFVRERYPTFQDAVNDLDDAMSLICLFVEMQHGVTAKLMKKKHFAECSRLKSEWMAFIAHSHALRKVFVSIKGIYYQADVLGSPITWLAPHPQRMKVPTSVDVLTMTYFIEFYVTMLNFVLYRLYSDSGLKYPPTIDSALFSEGHTVKAVLVEKDVPKAPVLKNETPAAPSSQIAPLTSAEKARIAVVNSKLAHIISVDEKNDNEEEKLLAEVKTEPKEEGETIPEEFRKVDEIEGENKDQYSNRNTLFAGYKFFINREIPKAELRFMIRAFGGEDVTEYDCPENHPSITHQIVDRDCDKSKMKTNREYIQPQWIFDSINAGILLPYHEHDAVLPAHISPFVNDALKGYIPKQREHLDDLIAQDPSSKKPLKGEDEKDEEEGEAKYIGGADDDQETLEAKYEKELAAERDGLRYDGYVQDTLGQTETYSDSEDEELEEALNKKPKTKKELQEEARKKEADALENQAIGLLPARMKRKVRSIKGRLERRDAQNEALEQKRVNIEKKKKKAAKEAHKALPAAAPTPAPVQESNKGKGKNNNNNKRKEAGAGDDKPAKKAKK